MTETPNLATEPADEQDVEESEPGPAPESPSVATHDDDVIIVETHVLVPGLDTDTDTSMVESLALHLLSEHQYAGSLRLSSVQALRAHAGLHDHDEYPHSVNDHRFRPQRALEQLGRFYDRSNAALLSPLLIPSQRT